MNEPQNQNVPASKTVRVIKWLLIAAIAIVLNLFFNYATSLVYKQPTFDRFCPIELTNTVYTDKNKCVEVGGSWSENTYPAEPVKSDITNPIKISGYCNATYTCGNQYNNAESVYNRNIFIVLIILGIASLVLGAFITNISSIVALGFSFGGILSIIIGSVRYWSNMQDVLRVIVLAVALAALIWIALKKIKD